MPNYYSDGGMDWYRVSDDAAVAKATVSAIAALSSPTYAQVITAITTKDSKVTQIKPAAVFTRK